jgi:hypothetical protein
MRTWQQALVTILIEQLTIVTAAKIETLASGSFQMIVARIFSIFRFEKEFHLFVSINLPVTEWEARFAGFAFSSLETQIRSKMLPKFAGKRF